MEIHHMFCLFVTFTLSTSFVSASILGGLFQSAKPCPSDAPRVSCMLPPCAASSGCRAFPAAECKNNYCGSCIAEFWVGSNEVTDQCDGAPGGDIVALSRSAADTNCPPVRCIINPCELKTCPAKPSAVCKRHKCECSATFWEGDVEVTNDCTASSVATRTLMRSRGGMMSDKDCGNLPRVRCSMSPCDVESCPNFPDAQCRSNYCGGCSAEFWVGSKDVTLECHSRDLALNKGNGPIIASRKAPITPVDPVPVQEKKPCLSSCFFPPCHLSYCAAFPQAECRDDFCGGCRARYYVGNNEVTAMCRDRVPTLGRLFSGRRRNRNRSIFSPWLVFLDGMF